MRWRWAVALVLLTTLIVASGPQLLWETLRTANLAWALAAACLLVPWFMLGVVNVWLLVRRLAPLPFRTFVKVYAASWASSIVLPGQMGDATQIPLLRRYGVPVSASSAAYVTDKTLSLAFMVVVAILGIVVYRPVQLNGRWVAPVAAAGLLALLGLLSFLYLAASDRGRFARLRHELNGFAGGLGVFAREPRLLSVNIALTSLKWLLMIVSYVCGFRAFGVAVPFAAAATLPVMSSLVGYVPVSVGGLGTTEWTAVALFGRLGIPEPTVLAVFLFLRTSVLGMAILLSATRRSPRRGDPESAPGLTARESTPQSDAGCRRG